MSASARSYKPSPAQLAVRPREQAIREFIRNKIVSGELKPGSPLPPMQDLAKTWDSNYFTVYRALTPLVKEGLLSRQKGVGTFVESDRPPLKTVGIYYGTDVMSNPRHGYAIRLHQCLYRELKARGLRMQTWMDPRDLEQTFDDVLPEVEMAVETHHIQVLIAIITHKRAMNRLRKLPIPTLRFGGPDSTHSVSFSPRQFLEKAIWLGKNASCRTIGILTSPTLLQSELRSHNHTGDQAFSIFSHLCQKAGLETAKEWFHRIDSGSLTEEEERQAILDAYNSLLRSDGKNPDSVILFPDNNLLTLHEALTAENRSFDPRLQIISHRNEPPGFVMPQGPTYLSLDLSSVAQHLCQMVPDAYAGLPCPSRVADLLLPSSG